MLCFGQKCPSALSKNQPKRRISTMLRRTALALVVVTLILGMYAAAARGQAAEVKEKPPMYSYVGNWNIPRAQWADMEKENASDRTILDKALASGTIVGYGTDTNMVHQPDGSTHDEWWSAMSMAGLLNVLDQFYKSGNTTAPVLEKAAKH